MNSRIFCPLWIFFLVLALGCSRSNETITSLGMLEGGKEIAVPTGTIADQLALKRFPDARLSYYNTVLDCALAVKAGKAAAAVYDQPVLMNIAAKNGGLVVLDELLLPDRYGFAVSKASQDIKEAIDQTLASMKASGQYQELLDRWLPKHGAPGPMPVLDSPATTGTLRFGTAAVTEPMAYMDSSRQIIGLDIELAQRVALSLGKKLEIINMDFGALLPALLAGKVDMVGAGMSITEERAKSVLFSEPYYEAGVAALVKAPETDAPAGADTLTSHKGKSYQSIGVLMGSIHERYAMKTYPETPLHSFNTVPDMLLALGSGKVEAAFMDQTSVKEVLTTNPGFEVLEKNLFTVDIAAGFHQEADALREQFNQFLSEIKTNGTYDAMVQRWMVDDHGTIPPIALPTGGKPIRFGIVSDIGLPFTARVDGQWKGFDIELDQRFASWARRKPEWIDMPFGSLLPSLVSGKIDVITASMMITDERKKQIDFSDPYYASGVSIIGNAKPGSQSPPTSPAKTLDDYAEGKIGIFTGTVHDQFLSGKYPKVNIFRFESTPDMMLSLKSDKIDAALFDLITARLVLKHNPELEIASDNVLNMDLGMGFNKNNPGLLNEFNAFLKKIREDGTYGQIEKRWFTEDAELAVMPKLETPSSGKKLVVGVSVDDLPYVAVMNGDYVGFDIEIIRRFALHANYELEIVTFEFPALVTALASGKVDMITDGIAISKERAKQINFSDPYATFRTAMVVHKSTTGAAPAEAEAGKGFFQRLSESFHNNIILEKRYLMIINGLLLTILISVFSAILGTILGAGVCAMRMSRRLVSKKIAYWFISLVRGTPVLVLLMIIYYVVFASVNINPVVVSVIAFGINFAAYVSEMFRTGIESIDKGQVEAGIASGFTRVQTFIFITLPQALRQVLPVYKGEFISLVKMTSIVGYIAVEDLTKASDIIRSRTFDAFFPLIMAAVIYIFISWLLTLILDYIEVGVDPKQRRNKQQKEAFR